MKNSPCRGCQDLMSSCLGKHREHGRENKGGDEEDANADDVWFLDAEGNWQMIQQPNRDYEEQQDDESDNHCHKQVDTGPGEQVQFFVIRLSGSLLETHSTVGELSLWRNWLGTCDQRYDILTSEQKMYCKKTSALPARAGKKIVGSHMPLGADNEKLSTSAPQIHPRMSDPFPAATWLDPLCRTQNDFPLSRNKHSSRCRTGRYFDPALVVGSKQRAAAPVTAIVLWKTQNHSAADRFWRPYIR